MQGCLQCRAQGAASFELAGSSPRLTACIHPPNLLPCRLPQAQQGLFTVEVQVGGSQLHACAVERLLGGVETAPPMWMAQPGHRGLRLRPALPPPLPLTPHSEAPCWAAAACCWRWTTRRRWRSCASWRAVPQVCELHRRTRWAPAVGEREGHAVCRQACILVCWVGFCLTRGAVYPYMPMASYLSLLPNPYCRLCQRGYLPAQHRSGTASPPGAGAAAGRYRHRRLWHRWLRPCFRHSHRQRPPSRVGRRGAGCRRQQRGQGGRRGGLPPRLAGAGGAAAAQRRGGRQVGLYVDCSAAPLQPLCSAELRGLLLGPQCQCLLLTHNFGCSRLAHLQLY